MAEKSKSASKLEKINASVANISGLALVILFFTASAWISYSNTHEIREAAKEMARTHETLMTLTAILADMQDAETGQRGYVLTGNDEYLAPYRRALSEINTKILKLQYLTNDTPMYQVTIGSIKGNVEAKLAELSRTIELRRTEGFDAALDVVKSNSGKEYMDSIRKYLSDMVVAEQTVRQTRAQMMTEAYNKAVMSVILSCLFGLILVSIASFFIQRSIRQQRKREWLRDGQAELARSLLGNQSKILLAESVLKFFSDYTNALAGAFFVRDGHSYERNATLGVPSGSSVIERFERDDGLLGQAAAEQRIITVSDVPDGYLFYGSSLGKHKVKYLMLVPAIKDGKTIAVFELGFTKVPNANTKELLDLLTESIALAVIEAEYRQEKQEFLEETQRQSEELQSQTEELRVTNEELEEQGRALKESQTRLEQQQAELEQTNSQLEEQAQQLEHQRNDLARANFDITQKADEIEKASQYKSDFLANMSHELRTPLNSSLILSKLLADNPMGNLTADQVKYARTIESAGNDLLTLINDILDLSKIEAGHMEIMPEKFSITRMLDDIERIFEPVAAKKKLIFKAAIAENTPDNIVSDRQRLEQILKNLLSNACKFTDNGSVELSVTGSKDGVLFSVTDTGIGISEEKQGAIFDAFRQADGTISRKYGGTGLGLSISRELTLLLGGRLSLQSERGKGSVFSLFIPLNYAAGAPTDMRFDATLRNDTSVEHIPYNVPANLASYASDPDFEDDRKILTREDRTILIVEDDRIFARILRDLAHEFDFRCLIAGTAEDALLTARQYLPSAIVLDVGLPDNTGLSVLDRLKRDARTRHIPVHVVSGEDYARTAMSMGALGYALKPVKRDDLAEVFRKFEEKLPGTTRRVLVVEDDPVQRESIAALLNVGDVEIVGAGTASECLALLKEKSFDCMVLDLTLPDASGYTLLETLSQQDAYAFPPVIIYTGKDLDNREELLLRKYSKSIIIKGAKSPERLLDEVTLFLHQVVSDLPPEQQKMIHSARSRDDAIEGKRILIVEDDARNVFSLRSILEPCGATIEVAQNGREAVDFLENNQNTDKAVNLVLMDVMMPEMDGLTATREIRKRPYTKKLPIIMLTAKAMRDDQEKCLAAGANDYMAKPLDVEKLLSLVRVWMPR